MIALADFLAANPEARVHGPTFAERFQGFCFDSRIVQPGELFLAVKTDKADGHDYAEAACLDGALGVVAQRPLDVAAHGATCIVVPDTEAAIQAWARHIVRARALRVVAITGSVGKTSTKEILAHVLGAEHEVFHNPANYSGRYGLPIALGGLEPDHELAVLEMATDQFGEIALLADLAPPEVACVTRVAPAHLDAFGDVEAVAREKGDLVAALRSDGLALLNADDPRVAAMAARSAAPVLCCGVRAEGAPGAEGTLGGEVDASSPCEDDADVLDLCASNVRVTHEGTHMRVTLPDGRSLDARLPWLGAHFATSVLFAFAVGRRFGMRPEAIAARLATTPPVAGRLNPLPGRAGSLILDDSYNASPAAVHAALRVLRGLRDAGAEDPPGTSDRTRRIAVLGDMAELGDASEEAHRAVGRDAAEGIDLLVTRGEAAAAIAEGAREAGMDPERVVVTHRAEDAVAAVEPYLSAGTLVLAKGSAVTRMEQVVAALMAEPETAVERLVRQDAAWRQIVVLRPDRPTWLEIDLGAVADNTRHLKALADPAQLMAVIKADAYGHGGVQVARTALHNGATWLGVACLPEGEALRRGGIDAPMLVLGYTPAWQAREALRLGLDVTLYDLDTALAFSRAAEALDRPARVHVKVDTGLHRLGVAPQDASAFLVRLYELPGIEVVGLFTHFAVADESSVEARAATDAQVEAFDALLGELDDAGLRPAWVHAANSAALLTRPETRYDLVRPGIALYGLDPSPEVADEALRPVLAWKTQVAQVRRLAEGEAVGYGHAWRAERPSRVATIPVGYADGFRRAPRRWRHVLVRGRPAPLVGRVSMDQAAIDVTGIGQVRQGDEVVLIGRQGEAEIRAEQVAEWLGTIHYEVVSAILARVARVS